MRIRHARLELELRQRKAGSGTSLLLLHELYGSSRDWGEEVDAWPGAVYGLDFCGHGASERLLGGAYSPELLLGDADAALAAIGSAALAGKGLGAYVALLLAGARSEDVPAALLAPGRGLAGGGEAPEVESAGFARYLGLESAERDGADPRVRVLDGDPRPRGYAGRFARAARRILLVEDGGERPPWWEEVRAANALRFEGDASSAIDALLRAIR